MAEKFDFIGAVDTIEVLGGGQTRPVKQVTATAQPSGFSFTTVIAPADFRPGPLELILGTIADWLNDAAELPGVVSATTYQDFNSAGQFVFKLDVEVESSSGRTSETIHPPYSALGFPALAAAVKKARDNMNAIEAL